MKNRIQPTKYYVPIYCYRHWPTTHDIIEYLFDELLNNKKITMYKNREVALARAQSQLCDDDCCAVGVLDFTESFCDIYIENDPMFKKTIKAFDRDLKNFKII